MPTHRLSPRKSLQKLRTAFSPSPTRRSNPTPLSPTTSATSPTATSPSTSTSATSPTLTLLPSPDLAGFNFGAASPEFGTFPPFSGPEGDYSRRVIRRKKSCVELEQEQEVKEFGGPLLGIVEPRPRIGLAIALGGIEEVLCGEV